MDKAVILARGMGTRMRKADASAQLDATQAAAADSGVKAMIPIGRPFLDYLLSALADAGYGRACLVIGPEHQRVRDYYTRETKLTRITVDFAIQERPLGTANAVAAAETFAGGDPFLMLNSDNYYPVEALQALRQADGPAAAVFDQDAMLAGSNIPPERISKFAVVETTPDGLLKRIVEKPDEQTLRSLPRPLGVSMNCWRFGPSIFRACRAIRPSPRGEFEITDAVQYAVEQLGERFRVMCFRAAVLDLSSRGDIAAVAERLMGVRVEL